MSTTSITKIRLVSGDDESGERAVPPSQIIPRRLSQCPEADFRASLGDADFWWYVVQGRYLPSAYEPSPDDEDLSDVQNQLASPCPECGEVVCGTDMMGRPMFHRLTIGGDE